MTNVPQQAVLTQEAEPKPGPGQESTASGRPSWRNLNFGPRMWVAVTIIVIIALMAVVGPFLYPFKSTEKVGSLFDEPTAAHILGTDNFGHDIIAVLMMSTRNSLLNGLMAGTLAVFIGVLIGILAGYVGGWVEEALMGVTNIVVAIPSIVVLILISMSLQHTSVPFLKGIAGMSLVIGITSWPWTARAVRAQASSVATREHIDIAKLSGARTPSILVRDVLPYLASYVVMAWVLQLASAILAESTLSMLGLGVSGTDSLGMELHWALAFQAVSTGAWWAFLPPTIILTMISFSLLYLQSSLDEVFNPRLRRGKKKNLAKAAARRAEAARQLAEQNEKVEVLS
ncbi:MAG TPA: ABC transporter permease [Propionibacteriaceae bacterium]|nr:ABC transporter permease [Propionibacteriaceae bacterium]